MKKVLFSKCGIFILASFFVMMNRLAAQDCDFTITASVQNSTCVANGIITINLEDTIGKRIHDMRYSLQPVVAGANQSTNNILRGIPPGTYTVIVDALCSAGGSPVQVQETLANVVVENEYIPPTVTRVEGNFSTNHLYGSVPSLPCSNTGVTQIRIRDGVFPFTVVIYHNGDSIETKVFDAPMMTGENSSRYNFKEYYTFSGLAPGNYAFEVTDACGTGERISGITITELTESFNITQSMIYRGPKPITDDINIRFTLFNTLNRNPDLYYYYYMHTQDITPWWEFSYKIGDDGTYSNWQNIIRNGEETITLPLNGYCELYDSTTGRKNNIIIRIRAIGCTDPDYDQEKAFLIKNPANNNTGNYIKYATDSSIYHPQEYHPCYYITEYSTQYQHSEFLSVSVDTLSVNGTSIDASMYYTPPLTVQAYHKEADTLILQTTARSYKWECNIPLTPELNGETARISVTDKFGCSVYDKEIRMEYKSQVIGTLPPKHSYEWRTNYQIGDLCGTTMKNISIFRYPFNAPDYFSYLHGASIRLIGSPDENLHNFTAIFDTLPSPHWEITTTEGFPSGASLREITNGGAAYFFLESRNLPSGIYTFEITSDCKIDTVSHNFQAQDTLYISEYPQYDLIKDCASFKVVPIEGQIKQGDNDYQTYFKISSGPQGGYSPANYKLNDTIELTMTGTYVLQMFTPETDYRCATSMDTIVYERFPLRYAYLHAYVCSADDQTAKVKVTGQDGAIPYQYVVYSQPDGGGTVLGSGNEGDFPSVNARLGDVISAKVSDFCGSSYLSNIEVINLETARIAWFGNNNQKKLDICQGDSVFMEGLSLGNVTYRWVGPENFVDTLKEVLYIPRNIDKSGWYNLEVDNTHCVAVHDSIYLTVHNRPSAVLSGRNTVCHNSTGNLSIALTGAAPWTVVTSNNEILEIPVSETVNGIYTWRPDVELTTTSLFTLVSVSDSLCSGDVSGSGELVVRPPVTAVLSGTDTICLGETPKLEIELTGTAPWKVVANNGDTINITSGDVVDNIYRWSPRNLHQGSNVLSLTGVMDNECQGTVSGSAILIFNTPPVFSNCPAAEYFINTQRDSCSAVLNYSLEITGYPTPDVSYIITDENSQIISSGNNTGAGIRLPKGKYFVIVNAQNDCGNISCSFPLRIRDTQSPEIRCPLANNIPTDSFKNYYTVRGNEFQPTNEWDNCPDYILTNDYNNSSTLAGAEFPLGKTTVQWSITDASGNGASCRFDVKIIDTEPPVIGDTTDNPGAISCETIGNQSVSTDLTTNTYLHKTTDWDVTATDNVGVDSLWYVLTGATTGHGTSLQNTIFNLGTTLVTWSATDTSGNMAVCTFNVTVRDSIPPVIGDTAQPGAISCETIGNQVFSTDSNSIGYLHTGTHWDVTATDNVGVESIGYALIGATEGGGTSLNNVFFNIGLTTVMWTATDTSGNMATCSFNVTIRDSIPPVIGDTTDNPGAISCETIGNQFVSTDPTTNTYLHKTTDWDVTATDNVGVDRLWYVLTGATTGDGTTLNNVAFNIGLTTVMWTATDTSGNMATCSFNVTIRDSIPPVIGDTTDNPGAISCETIGDQVLSTDSTTNTYLHKTTDWNVTATDNVGVDSLWYVLIGATTGHGTSLQNTIFNMGTTLVTWFATDTSGNLATCSFNVTINDSIPPVIGDTTDNPGAISCETIGNQTLSVGTDTNVYIHVGTTWDVTATDNVMLDRLWYDLSGATTGAGNTLNGQSFNIGTTTVTWSATDTIGNLATCSFRVSIGDSIPPVIGDTTQPGAISCETIGNQLLSTAADTNVYIHRNKNWDVTATDNIGVESIWYTLTGVTTGNGTTLNNVAFNIGLTTVMWTATDTSGNMATCSFNVTIHDSIPPVIGDTTDNPGAISCQTIGNQSVSTDPATNTYLHKTTDWNVTATDNVGVDSLWYVLTGATTGHGTSLQNTIFNLGTTLVTWSATDTSGNMAVCTFNVTVRDSIPPVIGDTTQPGAISCETIGNQNLSVGTDTNVYIHAGTTWDVTATDNVMLNRLWYDLSGATTGTGNTLNGQSFNIGTTTVTWSATDTSGNLATCSFRVSIGDSIPPVIGDTTRPGAISCETIGNRILFVSADTNVYIHNGTDWDVTATDNVGIERIWYTLPDGTTGTSLHHVAFYMGNTTVTWYASDTSGNIASCNFMVTVRDTIPPVIGDTTEIYPDPISCITIGDQVLSTDSITNTYLHKTTDWNVTATDNVGVDSLWYVLTGATTGHGTSLQNTIFNMGTTLVTWFATDTIGNLATCSFNVTINDSIPPVIGDTTQPGAISCETIGDQIVYTPADTNIYTHNTTNWDITATDNVMLDRMWYELTGATQRRGNSLQDISFNIGITTVQWFVTDTSDNMATCSFTVDVRDTIPPVIGDSTGVHPDPVSCLTIGDQVLCVESTVGVYVHPDLSWDITATDNDSIVSVVYYLSGATTGSGSSLENATFNDGLTHVLWVVTDRSGNVDSCSFEVSIHIIPEVTLSGNATIRENDPAPLILEFTGNLPITIYHTITGSGDTNTYVIPDTATSPHTWLVECQQSGTYELVGVEMETPCEVTFSGAASVFISECLDEREIVMECPENILRTLPYGECNIRIALPIPLTQYVGDTIEGNNPNIIITNNAPQGNIFTPGIHTIIWTATDACEVTDTCTQLVVINQSPCGINDTIWSIDGTVDSIANIVAVDSEGNEYNTVRINCDCWTSRNVTSKQFSDDASLLNPRTRAAAPVMPQRYIYYAKAYPDMDANELRYGGLYNWHAASKLGTVNERGLVQGICPNGWVLPTVDKYEGLIVFGSDDLRQPSEWMQDNTALNGSGFSAFPAGYYNSYNNTYYYLMGDAYFWTAAEGDIGKVAHIRYLCPVLTIEDMDKNHGASVRCIKANEDATLTTGN